MREGETEETSMGAGVRTGMRTGSGEPFEAEAGTGPVRETEEETEKGDGTEREHTGAGTRKL